MSTIQSVHCSKCGQELTATARGMCASCLLRTALSLEDGTAGYRILTVIGGDTEAVTYLAEPATGAEPFVALKVIGPRRDVDDVLARYEQWRPAFDRARHHAVRRIVGAGSVDESHLYIASEYVTGQSLSATRAMLTVPQRDDVLAQVRDALATAHQAGIVHLNLTASRIRVKTSGPTVAKILGFETRTIIDGVSGRPEEDLATFDAIARQLHILSTGT